MNKIYLPTIALCTAIGANAEVAITYNHDSSKMNQITVQETGGGALSPSLYYQIFHNKYQKDAGARNKMAFRSSAGVGLYQQIDDAESLDSALTQRARSEALNMADRQVDLAWKAEGSKIQVQLQNFQRNIQRILSVGGRASHQQLWVEKYNLFKSAVKVIQQSYLPNSQRKEEYLRIYADIAEANEALLHYIVMLDGQRSTSDYLAANYEKPDNRASIAKSAISRWRPNKTE